MSVLFCLISNCSYLLVQSVMFAGPIFLAKMSRSRFLGWSHFFLKKKCVLNPFFAGSIPQVCCYPDWWAKVWGTADLILLIVLLIKWPDLVQQRGWAEVLFPQGPKDMWGEAPANCIGYSGYPLALTVDLLMEPPIPHVGALIVRYH